MTDRIEVICLAEKEAQAALTKYDKAWRATFWATNALLAEAETPSEATKVLDRVEKLLGQSRDRLSERRRLGKLYCSLGVDVSDLPPRKASEVMRLKLTVDQSTLDFIRESDRKGESVREFLVGLTGRPQSLGSPETVAADLTDPKKIAAVVGALTEESAQALGRAVAENPTASNATFAQSNSNSESAQRLASRVQAENDAKLKAALEAALPAVAADARFALAKSRLEKALQNGSGLDKSISSIVEKAVREFRIGQRLEQNRKANEAKQASRPAWLLELVNIPIQMAQTGERLWSNLRGDPAANQWNADSTEWLMQEVAKAQAVLDRLQTLPMAQEFTVNNIAGEDVAR